jgi:N-acetylmuramoyl-L-alanine amidase
MTRRLFCALILLALAGCAGGPRIDTTYVSAGNDSRVRFVVLHFTSTDFEPALRILTGDQVSSHYLVNDNPPTIYRLVDESRRAYHAGVSSWKGYTQLNESSIGIEIVNRGFTPSADGGSWAEYPQAQIDAVLELVKDIHRRHGIRPGCIVGHSDVAPQRKPDPGPKFPWKRFADAGLVPWPDANEVARRLPQFEQALPDVEWFQEALARYGYAVPRHGELDLATRNVLVAFQTKYRPARFDGAPDAETAALLDVLVNP